MLQNNRQNGRRNVMAALWGKSPVVVIIVLLSVVIMQ